MEASHEQAGREDAGGGAGGSASAPRPAVSLRCFERVARGPFIACQSDRHQDASILSICDDCGIVEESAAPDLLKELSSIVGKSGFAPMRHVIEIHGVCASCGAEPVPA